MGLELQQATLSCKLIGTEFLLLWWYTCYKEGQVRLLTTEEPLNVYKKSDGQIM